MEITIPEDLENHEIFDFPDDNTLKAVVCNATDILSTIYSCIYVPPVSFDDYQSLKNDFDKRQALVEKFYNIELMIDVVQSVFNENKETCTIDPETPFTVIQRNERL